MVLILSFTEKRLSVHDFNQSNKETKGERTSPHLRSADVGGLADIGGRKICVWILGNMHYENCSSIPKLIECKNI
jgi:hypothetical protein